MSIRKKLSGLLSLLLIFTLLSAPASAAEEEIITVVDADELTGLIESYFEENAINPDSISVSYCYTGTGEIWMYNADKFSAGGSLYKLPLSMRLDSYITDGILTEDSDIFLTNVIYCIDRMLVYSDNTIGERTIGYFTDVSLRYAAAQMAGLTEDVCPRIYDSSNDYSPRVLLGILLELYRNTDRYPHIIGCMLRANPEHYLRTTLEGKYGVAQKYGSSDPALNSAAIVYTPRPFLISVQTVNTPHREQVIGDIGQILADYTLLLDTRLEEMSTEDIARAETQFDDISVSPERNAVPIYTAFSSEYYAAMTETLNSAAFESSGASGDE